MAWRRTRIAGLARGGLNSFQGSPAFPPAAASRYSLWVPARASRRMAKEAQSSLRRLPVRCHIHRHIRCRQQRTARARGRHLSRRS